MAQRLALHVDEGQLLMTEQAGRSCPIAYRYGAAALARSPAKAAQTVYVVGGLYGNLQALAQVEAMAAAEPGPVTLVFNGDFNWFNRDDASFRAINQAVLKHDAILGNVEFEFGAEDSEAGCGCAYPEGVAQGLVDRSNRIHKQLSVTARRHPDLVAQLMALPLFVRYRVGSRTVAVVHGDADSLAGWLFDAHEIDQPKNQLRLSQIFTEAEVDIFASTHTCLPVLRQIALLRGQGVVVNNGAAGMPNFHGQTSGLLTRIGITPSPHAALYGLETGGVFVDTLAINYDQTSWRQDFLANWPEGSDAFVSYFSRIENGPTYTVAQALGSGLI
jgi:hypothetical protein